MSIQPMAPGGVWLSEGGGSGTPHYVVNPDHIARLQRAGYQPIDDPRIPIDEPESEDEQSEQGSESEDESEKEEETNDDDTSRGSTTAGSTHKTRTRRVDTASR